MNAVDDESPSKVDHSQPVTEQLHSKRTGYSWLHGMARRFCWVRWRSNITRGKSADDIEMQSDNDWNQVDPRSSLFNCLTGGCKSDPLLDRAWVWYLEHIEDEVKDSWNRVLAPVLSGVTIDAPTGDHAEYFTQLARIYEVLVIIAEAIRSRQEISLNGILSELQRQQLISPVANMDSARQMVWFLGGILTMLYDPIVSHGPNSHSQLTLRQPRSTLRARGRSRRTVLDRYSEDISKAEEPFPTMLGQFGELLPTAGDSISGSSSLSEQRNNYDDRHLNLAYLNYHGLKLVAGVQIEWVNTMNLHLQLDEHNRILRLYRFPAFCRLLWRDNEECFLTKFFSDHRSSCIASSNASDPEDNITEFLREIIISYRLLFGINKASRRCFKDEIDAWTIDNKAHHSCPAIVQRRYGMDPLLYHLCTSRSHSFAPSSSPSICATCSLPEDLHVEETPTQRVYALADFPFLGRRLMQLQTFSMSQKPNDWWILWQDRRDVKNWWNVWMAWAVLLFGGGGVILQFGQLVFQAWGTILALKVPAASGAAAVLLGPGAG